ncbi:hypothetical protein N799_10375 [Lysobacter arseniciresistens ZS79]|uniref:Poly(3-hydroxyalkanoate) polymerase subunit PhaE n=1 Tax=Lysobacter arseniciresistens ZS79 TaxID=913325 RepID=A0A0A0F243_9GAMM|nr:class III poly(R)-hydroxyalkanoic acid synthase subunit PhaE [Lysobacter arseniciresistens]KGM57231.1 hypothetical protein N799_10375 [Lysobacter arseniciresistens ZS79]
MANQGFGGAGFGGEDFEALAREYWSRWGEMLRAGGMAAQAPGHGPGFNAGPGSPFGGPTGRAGSASVPGWNEALAWWSQLAGGGSPGVADEAMRRFGAQAQGWFGQMQQLATQFAGQDAAAADIAAAWKRTLGGHGANPFADALKGMHGPGQQGFEQWLAQVSPWLEQLAGSGRSWLGMPAFGFTREHQQRWQQLAQAHIDYQQQARAYHALMAEAGQDAFRRFEDKLSERSAPGRQLQSARALFDLWIDAAEEAYAEVALSPRFRDVYGAVSDAQMRLRAAVQKEVEQVADALGMPTRGEVDAAHRKVAQLERELRRLRERLGGADAPTPAAAAKEPSTATARPARATAKKAGPKAPSTPRKAKPTASGTTGKTAARKAPTRKTTVRETAAGQGTAGKPARNTATSRTAPRGKAR